MVYWKHFLPLKTAFLVHLHVLVTIVYHVYSLTDHASFHKEKKLSQWNLKWGLLLLTNGTSCIVFSILVPRPLTVQVFFPLP